jgi:hypothetical protein
VKASWSKKQMRILMTFVGLLLSFAVCAQAKRYGDVSYAQPQDFSVIVKGNELNPYADLFRDYCEQSDARTKQAVAKILGRPQPSTHVLQVPTHGSSDAKRYGVACMGGLVMLRIKNGWQQALDRERRYYTCRTN